MAQPHCHTPAPRHSTPHSSRAPAAAHPQGAFTKASSVQLRNTMRTNESEEVRKAAYEGLRSVGPHVAGAHRQADGAGLHAGWKLEAGWGWQAGVSGVPQVQLSDSRDGFDSVQNARPPGPLQLQTSLLRL